MTHKPRSREALPLLGPSGPRNRAAAAPEEEEPEVPAPGHLELETAAPYRWGVGRAALCIGGVILLYLLLRAWQLTRFDLWAAENLGIIAARGSWSGLFRQLIDNPEHPPLFAIVLKLWLAPAEEELLRLKLLPWLAAAATALPLVLLCRALRLRLGETFTALFLVATNAYLIFHAQEVRAYALALCFATTSLWLFLAWLNAGTRDGWRLAGLLLSNAALVYTHYFGWALVLAEALYLLLWARERLRAFGTAMLLVFALFLPWLWSIRNGIRTGESLAFLERVHRPGAEALVHWYQSLHGMLPLPGGALLALLVFGVPVARFGWNAFRHHGPGRRRERQVFSFLLLAALLPVAAGFLGRIGGQGVWAERYLIQGTIPWLLLVAIAVHRMPARTQTRTPWLMAVLLAAAWAGWSDLRTQRLAWEGDLVGSRVAWNALGRRLWGAESPGARVRVYVLSGESLGATHGYWPVTESFHYYLEPLAPLAEYRFAFWRTENLGVILGETPPLEHFWVAFFETPHWRQQRPDEALAREGYRVGARIHSGPARNGLVLFPAWRARTPAS